MSKDATPEAVVLSAHFADPKDAELVRKAAKRLRLSPSSFLRDVALRAAARIEATCPTCGTRHERPAKAKAKKASKAEAAAA